MKHVVKPCDALAQDQWSMLYLAVARKLVDTFQMEGRGAVREGVRQYAAALARERKAALLDSGCKTNLETLFADGFGFPCGERSRKEWVRNTEQELFLTVAQCPYADVWGAQDPELGRMFCEEYYPVLVHEGTSEKAQINLGLCMLNGRDECCRLSFYLRPANVSAEKRAECFPDFDIAHTKDAELPPYTVDYGEWKLRLLSSLRNAAAERIGSSGAAAVCAAAQSYATEQNDAAVLNYLKG